MTPEETQNLIHEYLMNNLRVEVETNYSCCDSRQEIVTTIYLGDEEVSKDSEYINVG